MFYRSGIVSLGIWVFISGVCFASSALPSSKEILRQAHAEVRAAHWDRSETLYLKAAQSPRVEDRILAYEGLSRLYQKVRLYKKTKRARKQLSVERNFKKNLLPTAGSYYKTIKIQKGDTYAKVASRYSISQNWLQKINRNKLLVAGKTMLVPKGRYVLVVNKASKKLQWKRGSEILKSYTIAIGREKSETPEGSFVVINKVKDPVWYRIGQVYPPDSPDNLLGTRWLGLDRKGYGIHGTRHPGSIGSAASHGCIRMLNYELEELFEWIPIGTKVTVHSGSKVSPV